MNIKEHRFKNVGPYGNKWQAIQFKEEGSLNLIVGKNGRGKCVHPDTYIDVEFESPELEARFIDFVESGMTIASENE